MRTIRLFSLLYVQPHLQLYKDPRAHIAERAFFRYRTRS